MEALGAIEPEKRLAGDASGEYWLAYDRDLDRDCLLRLHLDSDAADAEPMEFQRLRFIETARALASLDHANIARVLDYGVGPEGQPYLVLPRYPRRLTERLREDDPLELDFAIRLLDETCTGLAAAHREGLVHGALTPSSIFLCDAAPFIRLTGFYGQAGRQDKGRPESVDDVFQLGVLAYRLLSGRAPTADAPRPSVLNPALSPNLEAWTMCCLAQDRAIRPDAAPEALEILHNAIAA